MGVYGPCRGLVIRDERWASWENVEGEMWSSNIFSSGSGLWPWEPDVGMGFEEDSEISR